MPHNNEKYDQIIDEAYKNWCKQFEIDSNNFNVDDLVKGHGDQCWGYPILDHVKPTSKEYKRGQINAYLEGKAEKPFFYLSQEEFINKCKTDLEFSEKWGLKIVERELTWEEQVKWVMKNTDAEWENLYIVEEIAKKTTPKKLLTITYNNETIEVYE